MPLTFSISLELENVKKFKSVKLNFCSNTYSPEKISTVFFRQKMHFIASLYLPNRSKTIQCIIKKTYIRINANYRNLIFEDQHFS